MSAVSGPSSSWSERVLLMAQWSAMAWGAVCALAVIPAVSAKVQEAGEGWVRWTSTLAMLGFAVTILDNYWAIVRTPALAAAYYAGDAMTRTALQLPSTPQFIDVQGWLGYGAVGLWMLIVNVLALRARSWPKPLAYLGIVGAIGYFMAVMSAVVPNALGMILIVAGIGALVVGPLWYIWIGLILLGTQPRTVPDAELRARMQL